MARESVSERLKEAKKKAEGKYIAEWIKQAKEEVKKVKKGGQARKKTPEEIADYKRRKRDRQAKRVRALIREGKC